MNGSNQDELLQPVNGYQLQAVSEKIDNLSKSQDELKTLIVAQSQTYPTKTELDLQLEKRDNRIQTVEQDLSSRIKSLEKTLANYAKVVWTMGSAFVPIVALTIWQLIVNSAKGSGQ
ncbi:hypothetical protein [Rhodococcus sp. B10]|uniref:hypothetical protein n=1 Tax=Rhodococcus sp. B10 TaxID=2695876 RepID=UPI00142FE701|nr:hypothetical protein [Rhodococcus sp. B10]NIL77103.1 hypothetical protein [Rhodococcus sp. B10]